MSVCHFKKVKERDYGKVIYRDLSTFNRSTQSYPTTEYTQPDISSLAADNQPNHLDGNTPSMSNVASKKNKLLYVHYGLEKALTGESIGLVHRSQYMRIIKLIQSSEAKKKNLSSTFLEKMFPEQRMSDMVCLFKYILIIHFHNNKLPTCIIQAAKYFTENEDILRDYKKAMRRMGKDEKKPHFLYDINIDGFQFFKNSMQGQAYPILARIVQIGSVKIPISRSPPFIIGVYYGSGHPPYDAFLHDYITEVHRLSRDVPDNPDNPRSCTARLRAVICDAPMRAQLKGIVHFSGYYSCERCRVKYE